MELKPGQRWQRTGDPSSVIVIADVYIGADDYGNDDLTDGMHWSANHLGNAGPLHDIGGDETWLRANYTLIQGAP